MATPKIQFVETSTEECASCGEVHNLENCGVEFDSNDMPYFFCDTCYEERKEQGYNMEEI